MNTINLFIAVAIMTLTFATNSFSAINTHHYSSVIMNNTQETKLQVPGSKGSFITRTIKVSGVCGMCKSTIEKSASVKGVKQAKWDSGKQLLTLVFDPSQVKTDDVQKMIASAGYDTEKFKAPDQAYNNLHSCCKYERKSQSQ